MTMVLQIIKELPLIITTIKKTTKALRDLSIKTQEDENLKDSEWRDKLEKAIELQVKLNAQIENQMKIIQTVIEHTQKILRILIIISCGAIGLALLAVLLSILK